MFAVILGDAVLLRWLRRCRRKIRKRSSIYLSVFLHLLLVIFLASLTLSLSYTHTHTHTHTHTCASALFHSERHTRTSRVLLLGRNPKSSLIWNSLCICHLAEPTNSSVGVFIVSTKKNCHSTNKVFLIVVTVGKGKCLGRLTAWKASLCSKNIFDRISTAPEWLSTSPCDSHPLYPSLIGLQTHKNIQVSCWASESFQVISR